MRTRTNARRVRFPAPHDDNPDECVEFVFEEQEDAPCNEYIVMSQERELPALHEHLHDLHELGSRTIH